MAENKPSGDRTSWWSTLPALITAIAALVTAIGAIYLGILPYRDNDRTEPSPTIDIAAPANPVAQAPTPELRIVDPTERPPLETPTLPPPTPTQLTAADQPTYTNPTDGYSVRWDPPWQQSEATGGYLSLTNGTSTVEFEVVVSDMTDRAYVGQYAAQECVQDWSRYILQDDSRARNVRTVPGSPSGDSATRYVHQYSGQYRDYDDPGTWLDGRWEARCYQIQGNKMLRVIHFSPASDWEVQDLLGDGLIEEGLTLSG